MSHRYALVIGNSQYDDLSLSRLKTPEADVHALATALRDDSIGNFDDVREMINQPVIHASCSHTARAYPRRIKFGVMVHMGEK